jgi:uncharacterized membrane protein
MLYLILKLVHVLAVIIFVGNITVGILWKSRADSTRDPRIIAHTISTIMAGDRVFTIPAIIFILIAGFGAAGVAHINVLTTGWTLWGLGFLIIAGICFGPIARAQRALSEVALAGVKSGTMDWTRYEQLSARWNVFGTTATIAPILAVIVMVLKPALPAL